MSALPPAWCSETQGIVCTFSALAFLALWPKGRPAVLGDATAVLRRDPALLWLALGQAVWGALGLLLLWPPAQGITALRPLASTLNNVFLLMATAYFEHAPRIVALPRYYRSWRIGVLLCAAVVVVATVF